jgi:hypothetical protein
MKNIKNTFRNLEKKLKQSSWFNGRTRKDCGEWKNLKAYIRDALQKELQKRMRLIASNNTN